MYFHRFDRIGPGDKPEAKVVNAFMTGKCTVIPLVNPETNAGKELLNDNYCADISQASDLAKVDIIYLRSGAQSKYADLVTSIFDRCKAATGEILRDPAIIIFFPGGRPAKILYDVPETDARDLKKLLFSIFAALSSNSPERQLNLLKVRHKAKLLVTDKSDLVGALVDLIVSVFKA